MKHFVLLTLLVIGFSALAQTKKIDSLRAVLARHPQADTFRVNRLYDLAIAEGNKTWPPDNPAYLDSLATQAFQLAKHLNYPYGQANALFIKSMLTYVKGNRENYHTLLKQALPLAEKSGDKLLISQLLVSLGASSQGNQQQVYFKRALVVAQLTGSKQVIFDTYNQIIDSYSGKNYALTLQWALSLLAEVEKDTNTIHQYKVVSRLAGTYEALNEYDQALIYLKRSQQIASKRGDKAQQGAALTRIGGLYQKKGQPDKAIEVLKQGLLHLEKTRIDWVIDIERRLAECYEQKGQYKQALTYAHHALARMNTSEDVFGYYSGFRYRTWLTLGKIYLHTKQLDSALYYCNKILPTLQVSVKMGFWESARDVTDIVAQLYAHKGNFTKAYDYQRQYIAYKDSLNNEDATRKATAMRFNDQMSRQQSQIALLQKDQQLQAEAARRQRQFLYASFAVLILIGGLLALLIRNNRQKQRANVLLQQQKQEIQAQRDQTQQALTDLKTTQAQLVQKEKMASLGELTAGIAHEIQNPLNFVNNFSEVSAEMVEELAQEQHKSQRDTDLEGELLTDLKDNLTKILHHGQRASNIVRGMLEHSRSSSGELQPTNLNALTDEFLRLAYHGQRAKDSSFNCELVTHFDPTIGKVNVMSQEIGRVLLNLFTNAFYAVHQRQKQGESDYQPKVTVTTAAVKNGIEIRVGDNGTGMTESVQQKIFQPFFTTKPTGEGTGLGLSLSYDIITKGHGGTLTVESEAGKGTDFMIKLPTAR